MVVRGPPFGLGGHLALGPAWARSTAVMDVTELSLNHYYLGTMPKQIHRDVVRGLLDQGAQLVEVLPQNEYEEDHLPGAINRPLRRIDSEAAALLDRDRPIIVYCWDIA